MNIPTWFLILVVALVLFGMLSIVGLLWLTWRVVVAIVDRFDRRYPAKGDAVLDLAGQAGIASSFTGNLPWWFVPFYALAVIAYKRVRSRRGAAAVSGQHASKQFSSEFSHRAHRGN